MSKYRVSLMVGITVLMVCFMSGCETCNWHIAGASDGCKQPPVTALTVTTVPAGGATGVAVNVVITATFSAAVNPASINLATFTLTGPGGSVPAGVNSAGSTATLTPLSNLAPNTSYTITITTGAQNTAGTNLASNYTASFTTLDSPFVTSTSPANNAGAVLVSTTVTATFNEAMSQATLIAANFTLAGPGGPVLGTVTSTSTTVTFTPTNPLNVATTYTATITTGAQNAAGNPLLSNYVWTFMTVNPLTVTSTTPAPGAFSVPLNQVIMVTFNQPIFPPTLTATSFTVTAGGVPIPGTLSNAFPSTTTETFTPTGGLTTNTDYVATITTQVKSTTNNSLAAPYVWTFSTAPLPTVISTIPANGATGVLLTQTISATFSEAMNPLTITPATFTLTGPGGTAVAGTVNYAGTTATLMPGVPLTPSTIYTATITTGAKDPDGFALASNYVWTFRTAPIPIVPPAVIATNPANNATGVPLNQKITATFSEAMDPTTINSSTFTVTGPGGVAVPGTVTYAVAGSIATFAPTTPLAVTTNYIATITTGAKDLAGTPLGSNYVWTFTTGVPLDVTKPTIISTIPANGAAGVPIGQAVNATFSEAMDPATINSTTFTLAGPGGIAVPGLVTYAAVANTATFTPTANLLPSTLYTATVTTGATDLAGNPLGSGLVPNPWTFTTGPTPDADKPTIISTNPINASANVPINATVNATFSEAMDPLTITTATFQLAGPGGAVVTGTVAYDAINFIATFTPSSNLAANTTYVATISVGAADLSGNPLGPGIAPNPWSFTTGPLIIPPPPVNLGGAAAFGGIGGGAGMTNQGILTIVNGNIGTTGASTTMTGFHDTSGNIYTESPLNIGTVNGVIDTCPPPPGGTGTEGNAVTCAIATQALADANTAFVNTDAAHMPGGTDPGAGELGNLTLPPGIYKSAGATFGITAGDLTLDAQGNPNAFWVFQTAAGLTVGIAGPAGARNVKLINSAQAKNVFWHVGAAATINGAGGGTMVGTIIAQAGATFSTAGNNLASQIVTLNGRAIGLTASVTLVNTVINVPAP